MTPVPPAKFVRLSIPKMVAPEEVKVRSNEILNGWLLKPPVSLTRIGMRFVSAQPLKLPDSQPLSQVPPPVHAGLDWP